MFFEGQVRDLGQMPAELIDAARERLQDSDHLWSADQTRFVTKMAAAQHIVFRFPDRYPESHTPASYRATWREWEDVLAPLISKAVSGYHYRSFDTAKVMMTKLRGGGVIGEHVDQNPSSVVPHKIHVPLQTDPAVSFQIDGVAHFLEKGRAYEINNLLPHRVENRSAQDRIHFIFECYPTG